ncbi:MAG: hypothetical protein JWR15_4473 [Prosthecobacter sp.]|nr:hypothetical protein [Prosthecobacter sp.]
MISEFNRRQILWGVFGLAGSIVCYVLAWLFFQYGAAMALHACSYSTVAAPWLALLALAGITFSGWRTWENGQGFQSYAESALCHDFGGAADTAGAYFVDHYAGRVTGPAYVLSQICLGGPLLLLKNLHRIRTRVPEEAGLEQKLAHLLTVLHAANKWQGLGDYPRQEREVLLLNLMKKIDFSQHKGNVRFKAHGI